MTSLFIKDAQAAARDRELIQLAERPRKKRQAQGFTKLMQALLEACPGRTGDKKEAS